MLLLVVHIGLVKLHIVKVVEITALSHCDVVVVEVRYVRGLQPMVFLYLLPSLALFALLPTVSRPHGRYLFCYFPHVFVVILK